MVGRLKVKPSGFAYMQWFPFLGTLSHEGGGGEGTRVAQAYSWESLDLTMQTRSFPASFGGEGEGGERERFDAFNPPSRPPPPPPRRKKSH